MYMYDLFLHSYNTKLLLKHLKNIIFGSVCILCPVFAGQGSRYLPASVHTSLPQASNFTFRFDLGIESESYFTS